MARGARPELFMPQKRGKGKGTKIPLKAGSIDALKVFLPPGAPPSNVNPSEGQGAKLQETDEDQGPADQAS